MKKMVYQRTRLHPFQVLYLGTYKRYTFFILNMGTHPTAYIKIPKSHPFFQKDYFECNPSTDFLENIFTFSGNSLAFNNQLDTPVPEGWYLGWDHAHVGDWLGYWSDEENIRQGHRKYTTKEMIEECKLAIIYLIGIKDESRKKRTENSKI